MKCHGCACLLLSMQVCTAAVAPANSRDRLDCGHDVSGILEDCPAAWHLSLMLRVRLGLAALKGKQRLWLTSTAG